MDDKELIEALKAVEDTATETRRHARAHIVKLAAARLTALAEEVAQLRAELGAAARAIVAQGEERTALAEEVERLKKRLGMVKRESERDARDAAIEARWQARNEANGEPYGTY